ncbi:biotin-dependent carboxyltransferase family protein [Alteromonas confluentis]|uniref:Carboxyltransferase domain-containing protein n=1 Tax=Alteromonas confluentis TaxID=1656094 RepID=A0A1E7Z5N8_9ALTE|nr:biotin-dependent carboxyltransferase family protein [Alteromonas confluentis]OFC68721.1 hypothetical protein BFC18_01330 [Alteromonas confluentis]
MTSLNVISPGIVSLLVDGGRIGMQDQGFSGSGPLDPVSFRFAQWLCGNAIDTAAIEIVGNAAFRFNMAATIALCGPDVHLTIDGGEFPTWQTVTVKPGQTIQISAEQIGQRYYLAVSADWQVPTVAGSACTVMREKLGGLKGDGSPLKAGDDLSMKARAVAPTRKIPYSLRPDFSLTTPVDIIPGYQHLAFDTVTQATFYSSAYTVTPQSDRMGMRLSGAAVPSSLTAMRSEGINFGSVQVPSDGQPIIMLADRQTLGGYPKIGVVASYDIPRLAQAVAGSELAFTPVDANNARSTWLLKETKIKRFFQE